MAPRTVQFVASISLLVSSMAAPEVPAKPLALGSQPLLVAGDTPTATASPAGPNVAPQVFPEADWTILVYLNGDNNLEVDAYKNFMQMAQVGSTDKVNIIVLFDRASGDNHQADLTDPDWTETLRFRVTKNMIPTPLTALPGEPQREEDMGDPAVLTQFVDWGYRKFPAKRHALIIWNHGQGWRDFAVGSPRSPKGTRPRTSSRRLPRGAAGSPFKAVSYDDTSGTKLYNSDITAALRSALHGKRLELLGFDACLMEMLETAYAFRDVAHIMVASEELEPGDGWLYSDWLKTLVNRPGMDETALGQALVDSYGQQYERKEVHNTTLTAIDLSKVNELARATSRLADALIAQLPKQRAAIREARRSLTDYGIDDGRDYFYHIDLSAMAAELARAIPTAEIKESAKEVQQAIGLSVIRNYAGSERKAGYGSNGLAIYFPQCFVEYDNDPFAENGYEKDNNSHPVEFVKARDQHWSEFLHAYFGAE